MLIDKSCHDAIKRIQYVLPYKKLNLGNSSRTHVKCPLNPLHLIATALTYHLGWSMTIKIILYQRVAAIMEEDVRHASCFERWIFQVKRLTDHIQIFALHFSYDCIWRVGFLSGSHSCANILGHCGRGRYNYLDCA